ncbi:MAG: hypothetical protein A2042_04210 [Candidatus Schekmanbacteria bacterium GWA2_38_11]|uniref:ABC transporter domain-containing protein n=1 Tax=Candidatus Schekmanbacteria bacterium GWA2_38_11 TaxID=1817876 RepID=A0A1F7RNT5_9BACT|nr:MAG: hypothetical protein A2042_04210 [Candidatus Schekmanbacteria bacterium GWA2_38_11]
MIAIEINNIKKSYFIHHERKMLVKDIIFGFLKKKKLEEFVALKDISFEVKQGESVGVIGDNGAGKTTILKLLSGVTVPTRGTVKVNGRVAGLLELGAGFHPDLTGRENIYLNGSILGLSKKEIDEKFDAIVDYSGIEEFIDIPLKNYSSGMFVRLGFAVAVHVDPDILLIDEVLAVGDQSFQGKCLRTIEKFQNQGKTLIFVSHDLNIVRHICDRVILLDRGEIVAEGEAEKIISRYWLFVGEKKGIAKIESGHLTFMFNNGKIIFLWKEMEITKNLSGYTSLRSFVKWFDSTQVDWRVLEKNEKKIVARGNWRGLPISQTWEMEVLSPEEIFWNIDMEVFEPVSIAKEQANIMLSDKYMEWETQSSQKGLLPEKFREDVNDDWDIICSAKAKDSFIKIIGFNNDGMDFPSVTFDCGSQGEEYKVNIINSNPFYKGRVLQCLKENNEKRSDYLPGKYHYFSGKISIKSS